LNYEYHATAGNLNYNNFCWEKKCWNNQLLEEVTLYTIFCFYFLQISCREIIQNKMALSFQLQHLLPTIFTYFFHDFAKKLFLKLRHIERYLTENQYLKLPRLNSVLVCFFFCLFLHKFVLFKSAIHGHLQRKPRNKNSSL